MANRALVKVVAATRIDVGNRTHKQTRDCQETRQRYQEQDLDAGTNGHETLATGVQG